MKNGTLQYETITGGGIDTITNDPIPVVSAWSEPIDCFIVTIRHTNKGVYQDGKFTVSTYMIHIEMQSFAANKVKITDSRNKDLGTFTIQDLQFLDAVQKIKIVV
ncbi:MAG: hypothetical protein NTZ69_16030 [Bacteroidia bacterium]|nr:hypothetical protein [Bacteroidia bacterium]